MKILYICTHNRCRSILSEAITNHQAGDAIQARSAGSQPAGAVHPLTLKFLTEAGIPIANLRSQSWDEFEGFDPDVVITLCDSAARDACPVWFGRATTVHWGLEDPSKIHGDDTEIALAFQQTIQSISARVDRLKEISQLPRVDWPAGLVALEQRP